MITSLEQEVDKQVVLNAEARPIGAQIDAAKARLARVLKAEDQLKERWLMLEEHVKANQQEKTAAQATLQELTSEGKDGAGERWRVQSPRDSFENKSSRLIGTTWLAGERSIVSERDGTPGSVSLGTLQVTQQGAQQEERHMNEQEVTGDRYQSEKMEHGVADDFDISIDFGEPDSSPAEDPTEWFAKMQRLAKEDDVTIARAVRASVKGGPGHGCLIWIATAHHVKRRSKGTRHSDFRVKGRTTLQKGGDARPRQRMARACAASHTSEGPRDTCTKLVSLYMPKTCTNLTEPQTSCLCDATLTVSTTRR